MLRLSIHARLFRAIFSKPSWTLIVPLIFCLGTFNAHASNYFHGSKYFSAYALFHVVHGIPGEDAEDALGLKSGDLDPSLPVDVSFSGLCLLKGFTFSQIKGPFLVPAGKYKVAVSPANSMKPCSEKPVIGPAEIPLKAGANVSIVAHLTEPDRKTDAFGLTASLFTNDVSRTDDYFQGRVIAQHTAAAPTVDIELDRIDRDAEPVLIEKVSNGDQVDTDLIAGKYNALIFPAGAKEAVFGPVEVKLRPRKALVVYAVGSLRNDTFTLLTKYIRLRRK